MAVEPPAPLEQPKLSVERRAALLAKFKEVKGKKVVAMPQAEGEETAETRKARRRKIVSWLLPLGAVAAIVMLILGLLFPATKRFDYEPQMVLLSPSPQSKAKIARSMIVDEAVPPPATAAPVTTS